jgi:hypothetical protein
MYYWYKMAFFDETPEGKYEAETISMDYIIFSNFSNYSFLCGIKSQLAWAKRPNAAWKRVKERKIFTFIPIRLLRVEEDHDPLANGMLSPISVADSDPFDTDPDHDFHFDTDPDPAF